ncbi:MAG: pantoate--beta-alanine ligase [Nitrospinae bacterium]|nr:pantoate--beta-alanine ligase [Nitrospinota bacterium]
MRQSSVDLKSSGRSIGFVPTMGALHGGHVSLINEAKKCNDAAVLSIFVNPTQFAPGEDYNSYPRDIERDKITASDTGVDILFLPSADEMYPEGFKTFVNVEGITESLCGRFRPRHFKGVATVVLKLFNIVMPDRAYFGEKDYQQLLVVKKMVKDLNLDIEIKGMPTIREWDGLAMSSRNGYLNRKERISAVSLSTALKTSQEMVKNDERRAEKIIGEMEKVINNEDAAKIDYISICDPDTLKDIEIIDNRALAALAVRIGKTRLIDNCILEVK